LIFYRDFARSKRGDIFLESNATHEVREPGPHLVAVEFAEQRGVVKSDPSAASLLDVIAEMPPLPRASMHTEDSSAE
jgi:hypothetical protein